MGTSTTFDSSPGPLAAGAALAALAALWRDAGPPAQALDRVALPGAEPVLPSSFAVATAAQASLAAAARWWPSKSGSAATASARA